MSYMAEGFGARVVALLQAGGVGFMPSDTIYGLSCRALDEQAVLRLRNLKSRSEHKPLIVLFTGIGQLADLGMPTAGLEKALPYWPGPLSLEWDARKSPPWLHPGGGTFAIRMIGKPELAELIGKTGPIISTSANPEGALPAKSAAEARAYFGERLDFYVDAGPVKNAQPSTLARITGGRLEVLRPGAVKIDEGGSH